ncbi:hypothetical protein Pan241w_35540 [Gimesia alba]|uniref:Nucleoside 2-deoxyribosyltransferase n=1 Tax=Gimesia alba TaxID=2527973 RepID=A0A517RHV2_9PLAN|nr:hypothetical protein [Gimesia alba]QDT43453.1 hypothetical protein Pan241w_35540 [Gimesia alba]
MIRRIYVIMPVASDPTYLAKRSTIETTAADSGFDTLFPLDAGFQFNLDQTLDDLRDCDLVVADVSNERPSCYYELGLVEASRKPVFVFAVVGTPVHQLANPESVIYYDDLNTLRDHLVKVLANKYMNRSTKPNGI